MRSLKKDFEEHVGSAVFLGEVKCATIYNGKHIDLTEGFSEEDYQQFLNKIDEVKEECWGIIWYNDDNWSYYSHYEDSDKYFWTMCIRPKIRPELLKRGR